ncbi:hypothetical protein Tco_1199698, partial [Tanacetum coccineum]
MHTSKDDYLINTLRFVSTKEETQIYGAILPDSLTSIEMKETKAYNTYIGFASGATHSKKARKFKKPASPKLTKSTKRVKRPAYKSTKAPARGVVIRETIEIPLSKKKEKVDVTRGKGIELLSDVALTKEAQFEEVRRKSMRDFHKTYIEAESWGNDEDDSNNEQESSGEDSDQENDSDDNKTQSDDENKSDFDRETKKNESGSKSDQEEDEKGDEDDEEEVKDESVKTPS